MKDNSKLLVATILGGAVLFGYVALDSYYHPRSPVVHTNLGSGFEKHCLRDNPTKCFCTQTIHTHTNQVECPI